MRVAVSSETQEFATSLPDKHVQDNPGRVSKSVFRRPQNVAPEEGTRAKEELPTSASADGCGCGKPLLRFGAAPP